MMLVTLDDAKDHLRIDTDDEDMHLELLVNAASDAVLNYLKIDGTIYVDSSDNIDPPYAVQAATLLMTGYLYRLRDNNEGGEYQQGYLPMPVTALLYPLRSPAIA